MRPSVDGFPSSRSQPLPMAERSAYGPSTMAVPGTITMKISVFSAAIARLPPSFKGGNTSQVSAMVMQHQVKPDACKTLG
jgi:hypothetical protein